MRGPSADETSEMSSVHCPSARCFLQSRHKVSFGDGSAMVHIFVEHHDAPSGVSRSLSSCFEPVPSPLRGIVEVAQRRNQLLVAGLLVAQSARQQHLRVRACATCLENEGPARQASHRQRRAFKNRNLK